MNKTIVCTDTTTPCAPLLFFSFAPAQQTTNIKDTGTSHHPALASNRFRLVRSILTFFPCCLARPKVIINRTFQYCVSIYCGVDH